jgi:hypothetical protein
MLIGGAALEVVVKSFSYAKATHTLKNASWHVLYALTPDSVKLISESTSKTVSNYWHNLK